MRTIFASELSEAEEQALQEDVLPAYKAMVNNKKLRPSTKITVLYLKPDPDHTRDDGKTELLFSQNEYDLAVCMIDSSGRAWIAPNPNIKYSEAISKIFSIVHSENYQKVIRDFEPKRLKTII
jgi:hypothetical protein